MQVIRKEKFDILTITRDFTYPYKCIGWYANDHESVIASLVLDCYDKDYGYILLGRDKRKIFRTIECCKSFESNQMSVLSELFQKLKSYDYLDKNAIFPQNDEIGSPIDIFEKILPCDQLHPSYKELLKPLHAPAKAIITELAYQFKTQDQNFITEFQRQFNPRNLSH